jgi:beta-lactamase superfamily II metal-dependent hydrolase
VTESEDSTFNLRVKILGAVAGQDRHVSVRVVDEESTVTEEDYLPIEESYVLKAGEVYGLIPIHFRRAASLKGQERKLVLELVENEGCKLTFITEPRTLSAGSVSMTLYPPLSGGTSNEEGLFVLCSSNGFDALITGDADSFTENLLIKYYNLPDLELLVAGHHGSKHSTSAALLDALRPELALISVGYNSYGHPAPETLERMETAGAEALRTDLSGTIVLKVRDGEVLIP